MYNCCVQLLCTTVVYKIVYNYRYQIVYNCYQIVYNISHQAVNSCYQVMYNCCYKIVYNCWYQIVYNCSQIVYNTSHQAVNSLCSLYCVCTPVTLHVKLLLLVCRHAGARHAGARLYKSHHPRLSTNYPSFLTERVGISQK